MSDTVKYAFDSLAKAHAATADAADHGTILTTVADGEGAVVEVPADREELVGVTLLRHGATRVS